MYLEDDEASDAASPEDEWLLDAEDMRQKANATSDPQDIKTIRKQARKMYKAYREEQKKKTHAASLVQHTTTNALDDVFGSIVEPLLNGSKKLSPLGETFEAPDDPMELMRQNNAKGVEWLRRAADAGHRDAYVRLGNLCMEHDPPLAHAGAAWYSLIADCQNPHPDALYNLGLLYYNGSANSLPPIPADAERAMGYFMKAAEVGDPSALFFMGHVLHVGHDVVPANATSSLLMLEAAAAKGHGGARYYLAQLYRSGDESMGIAPDADVFWRYLQDAVACDDADAMYCMADAYHYGLAPLTAPDMRRAIELYTQAAKLEHADALCCLGALKYERREYTKAFQYYQAAADRHSMSAWKNLADMYYTGTGVPQNKKTAESILDMLKQLEAAE
ncbi:hypothetical protein SPRG_11419 [Saprolegnia parasitica CBS 223.65]|uniref:Uncharacterized protein n=1 Tax=Saprolegnia parasitica (strain CBS 223.65) TaxID=695850 RepID=A0A067CAB5_SAPPC|nr:hypothetical protein SPRG_11419 [Saprolegnia parasitica CBS 223.65]KDO23496.1 hypothetical protein SPRG_11419 [Saprolegnia parasitica CBS 223.65]|eukprot:XP_012205810.1 hypothetical protein SPRG_11419 [Saprolegnia parasitica CBS 223.65]